jgi:hypothetical protein
MGFKNYLAKRKMKRQFIKDEIISPGPTLKHKYKESKIGGTLYRGQKATYNYIENLIPAQKRKKGKSKNPFRKIKDRGLLEGGFF